MSQNQLSRAARTYAYTIVVSGFVLCAYFVRHSEPWSWNLTPLGVFGILAFVSTYLTFNYRGFLPSRIDHQISSGFVYPVLFLVDPAAAIVLLILLSAADWVMHRRKPLSAFFNMGQMSLAVGAAAAVLHMIRPGFTALDRVDIRTFLAMIASLVAFAVVNLVLTQLVISLACRRRPSLTRSLTRPGLLNETLVIIFGTGMAVLWWMHPWLVVLGALPPGLMMLILIELSRHEQQLEREQAELRCLQDLGLEIGSELDGDRLKRVVVRLASQALNTTGALLLIADEDPDSYRIEAAHGVAGEIPETVSRNSFPDQVLDEARPHVLERLDGGYVGADDLAFLNARGLLFAPLEVQGVRNGLLVLFHGPERRRFEDDDVSRTENLSRFTNMALSNARLVADLRQIQEKLIQNEKMSALGMLVSGVAHELNNPLTTVIGYADILGQKAESPKQTRMLGSITKEARRAGKIVNNLLTFSRKHRPEKKPTDLNQIFDTVLELRAYDLRRGKIRIVRNLDPDLPKVLVDPHQFQQVFMNLVTNAEQALEDHAGDDGVIEIFTCKVGNNVRAVVSDNGPGIPKGNVSRIFLPFFTTKEVGRGTGLGLSICYGIIQEHEGVIEVECPREGGTRFTIDIPVSAVIEEAVAPPEPSFPANVESGRILVVDDEPLIAEMIRECLQPRGWSVHATTDGVEALCVVSEREFDVILVDMVMPGMGGAEFYEALRYARPELLDRVVFATGDAGRADTSQFLRATGKRVLLKPYSQEQLLDELARIHTAKAS